MPAKHIRSRRPGPRQIEPPAIIVALCQGPMTRWQLARALMTRPSCFRGTVERLLETGLLQREAVPPGRGGRCAAPRLLLGVEPFVALAMLRAEVSVRKNDQKYRLHGSLEYLQTERARFSAPPPAVHSSPAGGAACGRARAAKPL